MDRTLRKAARKNKRRRNRNWDAWKRFSPDGATCRYCKHDASKHLCTSGQPHFHRKATEAEVKDTSVMLYRHTLPEGGSMLVRRVTVTRNAELVTAFCTVCAGEIGTAQTLCYQRTLATGEVLGIETNNSFAV